jgi:hypothetical protein
MNITARHEAVSALPSGTCTYPMWQDPKGHDYWQALRADGSALRCGKPAILRRARDGSLVSSPYCQEHHHRCFVPSREMRRRAA